MRRNNGWISVHDEEKPESGEEVLALWYSGGFPAPEDLFADPRDRAYGICVYYYPRTQAESKRHARRHGLLPTAAKGP